MHSDPTEPQGRKAIQLGDIALTIETPPDLDSLLDKAAAESPEDVDSIPYYSIIWPSSVALASHLAENRALVAGKGVIELGCGLGLPSILCARLGADVIASDFHPGNEEWLLHNAELNGVALKYRQLDWNTFVAASPEHGCGRMPLVIGSDLVYEKCHIAALACAINALCTADGHTIIADPGRDNLPLFTAAMQKAGWEYTLYPEGEIYILHFRRKSSS